MITLTHASFLQFQTIIIPILTLYFNHQNNLTPKRGKKKEEKCGIITNKLEINTTIKGNFCLIAFITGAQLWKKLVI